MENKRIQKNKNKGIQHISTMKKVSKYLEEKPHKSMKNTAYKSNK